MQGSRWFRQSESIRRPSDPGLRLGVCNLKRVRVTHQDRRTVGPRRPASWPRAGWTRAGRAPARGGTCLFGRAGRGPFRACCARAVSGGPGQRHGWAGRPARRVATRSEHGAGLAGNRPFGVKPMASAGERTVRSKSPRSESRSRPSPSRMAVIRL